MDEMFFIRLYPNGITHRQEGGVLCRCEAPVVFQHPRINPLQELRQVMLHNLGGQFNEITEVGYCFLSPQPNRGPMWMLVWLLNDEHVQVTFECHRRLMAETIMEFLVVADEAGSPSVPQSGEPPGQPVHATLLCIAEPSGEGVEAETGSSDSDSNFLEESGSSSEGPGGNECIADTPSQVEFDALRISDPMRAGIADDYNTDGGVEFRVGHRLRNRDAVHMTVKNYSIRRNA
ncbi:hypothetical protein PIB30_076580 [Stylosanthes scabra]|uniref:Uncharacterized protein n=1 Tax=Stylosanthes scabra TaxID=79078 RepID=A0ABU6WRW3_9FABA|nr:hypothetical protein [Stylosanthes scabra]